MARNCNGNLYDIYYKNSNGEIKNTCYFAYSKDEARIMFNSERDPGDEIIKIVIK